MSKVHLIWATPEGEHLIAYMARVSNPDNQDNHETAPKLLKYLMKNGEWSPFEMVNACMEIKTTRDIGRQLLRHRSFSFQEFSQRYAKVRDRFFLREARMQDENNRQNSIRAERLETRNWWQGAQNRVLDTIYQEYENALEFGIAKEVARVVLPEGMTPTTIYMNGTLRSWIHFCQLRKGLGTQAETRKIANEVSDILEKEFPTVWAAQ